VEHGKTGFLVHNVQEMAEAMAAVESLDPALCHATAQRRFALDAMIERYFDVYRRLAAGEDNAWPGALGSVAGGTDDVRAGARD
jgi:glycosyltransferase involved in cell wall biosynthesis